MRSHNRPCLKSVNTSTCCTPLASERAYHELITFPSRFIHPSYYSRSRSEFFLSLELCSPIFLYLLGFQKASLNCKSLFSRCHSKWWKWPGEEGGAPSFCCCSALRSPPWGPMARITSTRSVIRCRSTRTKWGHFTIRGRFLSSTFGDPFLYSSFYVRIMLICIGDFHVWSVLYAVVDDRGFDRTRLS